MTQNFQLNRIWPDQSASSGSKAAAAAAHLTFLTFLDCSDWLIFKYNSFKKCLRHNWSCSSRLREKKGSERLSLFCKKKTHPTAASCFDSNFFFRFVWFSFHFLATATVVIFSLAGEGGGANPQPHFRFFFSKRPRPWSDHHQISWWQSCDWSGSDFLLGWTAPCWGPL